MKPVLYVDDVSPAVRSVLMLIDHLNIDVECKQINLFKRENLLEDFLKISPMHTVPALKHNDVILNDSHSILIYLCRIYEKQPYLYPTEEILQTKVLDRLFFNAALLFRRDSDVMTDIIQKKLENIKNHIEKITEAYDFMEVFLNETKFMASDHITLADLSIVATFSTVNLIVPTEKQRWPKLYDWFMNMKSLPYYDKCNENGVNRLRQILKKYVDFQIY